MKRWLRCFPLVLLALFALCLVSAGLLALDSRNFYPLRPDTADRIDGAQAGQLEETFHLRASLGETVWPGFGQASFPMMVGNDAEIFLVGAETAPGGWEALPASTIAGKPVFRRTSSSLGGKLPAFVSLLEGRWVPSWFTYPACVKSILGWTDRSVPAPLRRVFPYRIFLRFFFPIPIYVTGWEHETFHAFEAQLNRERFDAINRGYAIGRSYPVDESAFNAAWKKEAELLIAAVQEKSDGQARELAAQFLQQRAERRQQASLSPELVQYERDAEWLEGLAKYAELTIGRLAGETPSYQPAPGAGFGSYSELARRYAQQVTEVRSHLDEPEDGRFYYTGFLQAALLDRFQPGWKEGFFSGGAWVEEALAEALK